MSPGGPARSDEGVETAPSKKGRRVCDDPFSVELVGFEPATPCLQIREHLFLSFCFLIENH